MNTEKDSGSDFWLCSRSGLVLIGFLPAPQRQLFAALAQGVVFVSPYRINK